MRVLHLQKASGIGGSERHLLVLLPALARAGVEVRMGVAVSGDGERFVRELRERGVETHVAPAGADVNPLLVRWASREIRDFRPDAVHTHLIHADLHGQLSARLAGVPSVSSVHGTPAFLRRPPLSVAGGAIGRMPRATIAISEYVKAFLEQHRLRRTGSVRVVYYGIDASGWEATPERRAAARAELGFGADDVVVTMTARLIAGKGHDALIDAAAAARARAPALRVAIAGDGPLRASLESRARERLGDAAALLGFVDDVRPVIWASDVLAFPTAPELGEGFGLAALEAMAAGSPVVATRVGALPEVVADGETGVVVNPGRPRELADAMAELAARPELREQMGRAGQERARSRFDVETMVQGTTTVYGELLAGAAHPSGRAA